MAEKYERLPREFFMRSPLDCARELIGCVLRCGPCAGVVVETEAYLETGDPACHTFARPSARAFVSSHPAGTAYVYFNYGVHWLANVLTKGEVNGFVLLRALEPLEGLPAMRKRRKTTDDRLLASGPGRLTSALGIDGTMHGRDFCTNSRFCFERRDGLLYEVVTDVRIGISKAKDFPWRFLAKGNPHISRPVRSSKKKNRQK
jgi:DNA-3-methyladenine glycosylase